MFDERYRLDYDYESALIACARGEAYALESLSARESRWLLWVCRRILRDPSLAEDALQNAFLKVWQRAHTYDRNLGSARGWIYTVVRHSAIDLARRSGREISREDPHALLDEPGHREDGRHADGSDSGGGTHGGAGGSMIIFAWLHPDGDFMGSA